MYVLIVILTLKPYLVYFLVVKVAYPHGLSVTFVWRCDLLSVFVWWLKMENMCIKLKNFR